MADRAGIRKPKTPRPKDAGGDIRRYFEKIHKDCDRIFAESMEKNERFIQVRHFSNIICEFAEAVPEAKEAELLMVIPHQLESGALNLSLGLYRQAFASLRLTLELSLAATFFSINKLEYMEWKNGSGDIQWSRVIDEENGVLSRRFAHAFFPELADRISEVNERTRLVYRRLSEFIYGNYHSWRKSGLQLERDPRMEDLFFQYLDEIIHIVTFIMACRYMVSA